MVGAAWELLTHTGSWCEALEVLLVVSCTL